MSYTVQEVIEEIKFETSTQNQARSINDIFNEKQIVRYLKFALDQYAIKTLALEAIYSTAISSKTRQIDEPPSIIRSQGYKFGWTWIIGRKFPFVIHNLSSVHTLFPYDTFIGIPSWLVAWEKVLDIYPLPSNSFSSSTLTSNVSDSDTTIPVVSSDGFRSPTNGRITIENEKIAYRGIENNSFINCTRGVEETTAVSHNKNTEVKENNLVLYYYKRHFEIKMFDDNTVDPSFKNKLMEISDDHIVPIVNRAAGLLLKKIDIKRSREYEKEWKEWLAEAIADIRVGRSKMTTSGNIRDQFSWEGQMPYDTLRDY